MASARLYCTFLLLYLQGTRGQQGPASNQNVAANNALTQQQAMQRNAPNANQNQNGANCNYQQRLNYQQGNTQQPANIPGNMQQQFNIQAQRVPSPFNVQVIRPQQPSQPDMAVPSPKLGTTPQGSSNSGLASISSLQLVNNGKSNSQAILQQNMGLSNIPVTQISNLPLPASYAESMKYQPSLLSVIGPQNNYASNQQMYPQNPIPQQNQLTDIQKQMLVRSLQSQQPVSMQNQLGFNPMQGQPRIENQQYNPAMGQQIASYQPVVPPAGNQPAFITVQAEPLYSYLSNQNENQNQNIPAEDEQGSLMSLILSQLQPSSPQYAIASAYATPKKGKSSLKAIIPLIINLLKDKNECGCRNCGCKNGCGNGNEPMIFGGYSNQKNYSEKTEESLGVKKDEKIVNTANEKSRNSYMNNAVDSVETYSEENDSKLVEDEES